MKSNFNFGNSYLQNIIAKQATSKVGDNLSFNLANILQRNDKKIEVNINNNQQILELISIVKLSQCHFDQP